jgi:SAM-dependent methyltransferase
VGIPVQEVPIEWRHDERSKVRVARDGMAMVLATRRIWRNARALTATMRRGRSAGVFDEDNADRLMQADSDHWWFRSKAALAATAMRRARRPFATTGWLVDSGGGAGGVTAMLGWDPNRLAIVEGNEMLVGRAVGRHGLTGIRGDVDQLPLADRSVDVVCYLDVLEHLEEPGRALREAARVLAPGGRVVVNVPAHEWLWSEADELLGHVRRYTRPALREQLADAGFRPLILTHVFSWLVPPVLVKRRITGEGPELGLDQSSAFIDRAAMVLTWLERVVLGRVSLPLGTSILCVAETD